jgi:hypothetical protein
MCTQYACTQNAHAYILYYNLMKARFVREKTAWDAEHPAAEA